MHGLRSPLIPWFKINFLDFPAVGDHKVAWELSRHQHLVTLAKAWLLTGDGTYAREIFAQWYSWQRANPYPLGANWASSLEVAFRSLSHGFGCTANARRLSSCPAKFSERSAACIGVEWPPHRAISIYLFFSQHASARRSRRTFFNRNALSSTFVCPRNGRRRAGEIIQVEAVRQVRPDGVYFEQSLYYHVYALDFFLHARLLASRNGMEIPSELDFVIRKMLTVIQALAASWPARRLRR